MEMRRSSEGTPTPTASENEPNVLPAFLYSAMLCDNIGDPVDLNFFEPRYREMCKRMGAYGGGDPRFLFVPHFRNGGAVQPGDVAYVVNIQQMANLGTFLVRGRCISVVVILAAWVEPLTGGLHMCKFANADAAKALHRHAPSRGLGRGGERPEAATRDRTAAFKEFVETLMTEAEERCGDWTVHAEDGMKAFHFRKGERDLKASIMHLRARPALCAMVCNVPGRTGLALLGAREDLRQMLASLRELALRRTGAELDESLLLVPDLPRQDGKPSAGEAQQSGGDGDSKPSATPTGPHLPGGPFLVSMETILRTLQTFDEADLEPNPCADPNSWSDGLEAHIREYVVSTKPRELKRLLMTFLRADATGLLEASEIKELFGRLLLRKWRARHVGACIFNRFLKGSLSCEQIAEMSLCGETLATATMHVYPKVGMRSCTSDSLEAMNYYERMGPRVEETLQHGVQLPDQIGSQNEGCIHIMNIPSGNVNLSLLPQDVLVDSAAARAAVAQFSKSNFWNKAGHLVWAGHHKHPEQDCLLARLHPELLRRVCSFLIFPNDDRCWRR